MKKWIVIPVSIIHLCDYDYDYMQIIVDAQHNFDKSYKKEMKISAE